MLGQREIAVVHLARLQHQCHGSERRTDPILAPVLNISASKYIIITI